MDRVKLSKSAGCSAACAIATIAAALAGQDIRHIATAPKPPDVTITVADSVLGRTTSYIGATEAYVFDIDDLLDLGVNTYRMWTKMAELEWWDDDDAVWGDYGETMIGTPSIQSIRDDAANDFTNTVPWTWWDDQFGGMYYRWADPADPGVEYSRAEVIDQCISSGITPLLVLRNKDDTNNPPWAPDPDPLTEEDLNEWWEHCFAAAYWLNVRNDYEVTRFQVLNEPDRYGQGWLENNGTKEEYVTLMEYAYDAVKYANDFTGTGTVIHGPVVAGFESDYVEYSLSNADSGLVDRLHVADYHTYGDDPAESISHIRHDIDTFNPDGVIEPVWVSEWGALWATYDTISRALLTADQLMTFSAMGVQGVTIFNMYDWWTGADHALIRRFPDGTWARTETYYAYRLMIRGLIGAKDIMEHMVAGGPGRVMVTRDPEYVNLVVKNGGGLIAADLSPIFGQANRVGTLYEYSAVHKDAALCSPVLSNGRIRFSTPAEGLTLVRIPLAP